MDENPSVWYPYKEDKGRKPMKKNPSTAALAAALLALALAGGCFSPWTGEGNLTIALPGSTARTLVSTNEEPGLSYEINLSGPGGSLHQSLPQGAATATFRVAPGTWNITVRALGTPAAAGYLPVDFPDPLILRGYGETQITLGSGGATVPITLKSATEVSTWEQLDAACAGSTTTDREEIIFITGGISRSTTTTIAIQRPITLRGNGTIEPGGFTGALFEVPSGSLIIDGPTLEGPALGQPLVSVIYTGKLILQSGTITGNNAAGVAVTSGGAFIMRGGEISDMMNTGSEIYGVSVSGSGSSFEMSGGSISGTLAGTPHNGPGAGVYVGDGARFTMSGSAAIYDNLSAGDGGGIYIDAQTSTTIVNLEGGTIYENNAAGSGGGILVRGGPAQLIMSGGTIKGNTAAAGGGGVYVDATAGPASPATFSMYGGTIGPGNIGASSGASGCGVYLKGGSASAAYFILRGGSIQGNGAYGVYLDDYSQMELNDPAVWGTMGTIRGHTTGDLYHNPSSTTVQIDHNGGHVAIPYPPGFIY
jgi:hypothetical protein